MSEIEVMDADKRYVVTSDKEDAEQIAKLVKAMNLYTDYVEEFDQAKIKFEDARYKMEQMFSKGNKDFGLKSIKSPYLRITYVPASEGTTKMVKELNTEKALRILEELGVDEEEYMDVVAKTTSKRKESIRVVAE